MSYKYAHDKGFGEHHATEAGRELPAEMRDLDMAPGTEVEHVANDEDTGHLIVAWTDKGGDPRRTSITPDFFASHFEEL